MLEFLGLSETQIVALGTALGVFLAALFAGFRGYKAKLTAPANAVPTAALPDEVLQQIEETHNRVAHIEKKVDDHGRQLSAIYTDTQVIRDRKPAR